MVNNFVHIFNKINLAYILLLHYYHLLNRSRFRKKVYGKELSRILDYDVSKLYNPFKWNIENVSRILTIYLKVSKLSLGNWITS